MRMCVLSLFPGSYSVSDGSNKLTPGTKTLSVNSTSMDYNYKTDAIDADKNSQLWMDLMDQSQLVMTIVGFMANTATSITLIKNGQVGGFDQIIVNKKAFPSNAVQNR